MFGTAGPQRTDPRALLTRPLPVLLGLGGINAIDGIEPADLIYAVVIAGLMLLTEAVQWSHRWYELSDTELHLRSGILSRNERVVPLTRIQQVDHRQRLLHQVLGLAVVHVETAADAGQTSVTIDAIPLADAERMRTYLLERRHGARPRHPPSMSGSAERPPEGTAVDGRPSTPIAAVTGAWDAGATTAIADGPGLDAPVAVHALSDGQLAIAGISGASVIASGLLLLWPLSVLFEAGLVPEETIDRMAAEASSTSIDPLLVVSAVLAAMLLLPLLASVVTIIQWHGYQLAASESDLLVRHGLFDVRRLTIPRRRIQQVTVLDNPVRRRFGWCAVRLHSAASTNAQEGGGNVLQIPLVRRDELGALLTTLMGHDRWQPAAVAPRPPAAKRRAVLRRCGALGAAIVVPVVAWWPFGLLAVPLVALGVPWGLAAHRRAGVATSEDTATLSKGALVHREDVISLERLQSVRTSSSPLQRRVHLATLHLDVAGVRFAPSLGDLGDERAAVLLRTLDPTSR